MIAGFPNLFMITGPQTPGVKSQMILACEQQRRLDRGLHAIPGDHGFSRIEAEQDARMLGCSTHEVAERTLLSIGELMVRRRQHPGTRVFIRMSAASPHTRRKCDEIAARGYEGFRLLLPLKSSRFAAD